MKRRDRRDTRLRRRLTLTHDGRTFLDRWGLCHERWGGFYVHHIAGPDPGKDLHDHPWAFVTIILRGGYTEHYARCPDGPNGAGRYVHPSKIEACYMAEIAERWPDTCTAGFVRRWRWLSVHRMPLGAAHRIVDARPGTWTLVLRGPTRRTWGFYLPTGWVAWTEYDYDARRPSSVSKR